MIEDEFVMWCIDRESLLKSWKVPQWVLDDASFKTHMLLQGLSGYLDGLAWQYLNFNAKLHYLITTQWEDNPLWQKYNIASKREGIVSSASDESSSASYHITKSLNEADFTTQDLMMTPYGQYVYSILERLDVYPTLL